MTRTQHRLHHPKWRFLLHVIVLPVVTTLMTSSIGVYCAPARQIKDGVDQGERWLADAIFYDYDSMVERPQADGAYGGFVSSILCPPVPSKLPSGGCDAGKCSSDRECAPKGLSCCFNGCVYTCLPEVKPPPYFDWIKEPVRRVNMGQSWLVPGPDDPVNVEMCTTTKLDDDADPLLCPHGFTCEIDDAGHPEHGVPNRGHCVEVKVQDRPQDALTGTYSYNGKAGYDILPIKDETDIRYHEGREAGDARGYKGAGAQSLHDEEEEVEEDHASLHACNLGDGQLLLSGHSISKDGKDCLCYERRLVCN